MKAFRGTLLVWAAIVASAEVHSQAAVIATPIQGTWANKDTAIRITNESISKLHKSEGKWTYSNSASSQFSFILTEIHHTEKIFKGWMAASYTSIREYLTDGSERSTETVEYVAFKIERIHSDSIRLSLSDRYSISHSNIIPDINLPVDIKSAFAAKGYTSAITLSRLPD